MNVTPAPLQLRGGGGEGAETLPAVCPAGGTLFQVGFRVYGGVYFRITGLVLHVFV